MNNSVNNIAIRVKQLSKQYAKESMQMDMRNALASLFKKKNKEHFWALQDISFEVKKGEIIGIIGENGSGKSTLLKILSSITKPTTGTAEIYGRIASILDIGAGFHPDLTGEKNIYLKGQLLGMPHQAIAQYFDEIVAFSEIGEFIHMPIKHYSDGMFLRLAFSTLIHLDADILLLDEVMAVGDLAFQMKSMERIRQMAKSGKTILMVSHHAMELAALCTGYIHLQKGRIVEIGNSPITLQNYVHASVEKAKDKKDDAFAEMLPNLIQWKNVEHAPGNELFRLLKISAYSLNNKEEIFNNEEMIVEMTFQKLTDEGQVDLAFSMNNEMSPFMICHPFRAEYAFQSSQAGIYRSRCIIPADLFNEGYYQIGIFAAANRQRLLFSLPNILSVHVKSRRSLGEGLDHFFDIPMPLTPAFRWELHEPSEKRISYN